MPSTTRVVKVDMLFEHRSARIEAELDAPLGAVNLIDIPDPDRRASVFVRHGREVDRRHRHPVVRHGEVELDTEGGPCTTVANERLLDRTVRVEHLAIAAFVEAAVDVP